MQSHLEGSIQALDWLAASTARGAVRDAGSMERVFVRADGALAQSYRARAQAALAAQRTQESSLELRAAARSLADAATLQADAFAAYGASAPPGRAASGPGEFRRLEDDLAAVPERGREALLQAFHRFDRGFESLAHRLVAPAPGASASHPPGETPR